jgi:hypothetical protein
MTTTAITTTMMTMTTITMDGMLLYWAGNKVLITLESITTCTRKALVTID